jgi:quercetin dioxygenase-like cupin family protein
MEYLRRVDFGAFDPEKFCVQVLAETENCVIVVVRQPAGKPMLPPHYHTGDQVYYILDGTLDVEIDGVKHTANPHSAVFIPAGAIHSHVPRTDEFHLDIISPAPIRGLPLAYNVGDAPTALPPGFSLTSIHNGTQPLDRSKPRVPGWVRSLEDAPFNDTHVPGFRARIACSTKLGASDVMVNVADVDPGPGPSWHIHEFDQFYYVLEGRLSVDIVNKSYDVGPHELIVIPAGVPHRNSNRGDSRERHVTIMQPDPYKVSRVDMDINFSMVSKSQVASSN